MDPASLWRALHSDLPTEFWSGTSNTSQPEGECDRPHVCRHQGGHARRLLGRYLRHSPGQAEHRCPLRQVVANLGRKGAFSGLHLGQGVSFSRGLSRAERDRGVMPFRAARKLANYDLAKFPRAAKADRVAEYLSSSLYTRVDLLGLEEEPPRASASGCATAWRPSTRAPQEENNIYIY